jgi:hypothetical protein
MNLMSCSAKIQKSLLQLFKLSMRKQKSLGLPLHHLARKI